MATTITITINPGSTPTVETVSSASSASSSTQTPEMISVSKPAWARSEEFPVLDTARAQVIGRDTVFDETLKNAILDENEAYRKREGVHRRKIQTLEYRIRELEREAKKASSS